MLEKHPTIITMVSVQGVMTHLVGVLYVLIIQVIVIVYHATLLTLPQTIFRGSVPVVTQAAPGKVQYVNIVI